MKVHFTQVGENCEQCCQKLNCMGIFQNLPEASKSCLELPLLTFEKVPESSNSV